MDRSTWPDPYLGESPRPPFGEQVLYVLLFCGICGPSSHSLSGSLCFMGANVTSFWDSMGHAGFCGEFGVLLELWVGKSCFGHMEYGSWLFDAGCLVGKKLALF